MKQLDTFLLVLLICLLAVSCNQAPGRAASLSSEEHHQRIAFLKQEIQTLKDSLPDIIWQTHTPLVDSDLHDIAFAPDGTGVIVGDHGTILVSTDGALWQTYDSPTKHMLNAIEFRADGLGIITGIGGAVLTLTAGETDWLYQNQFEGWWLADIGITGTGEVVISGSNDNAAILVSKDGQHWNDQSLSVRGRLNWNAFAPTGPGAIISSSFALTSFDYRDWSAQELEGLLRDVAFTNTGIGIIVGRDGIVYRSEYGGQWQRIRVDARPRPGAGSNPKRIKQDEEALLEVGFSADGFGVIAGEYGTLLTSTDNGKNWQRINSGVSAQLNKVAFSPNGHTVIVGGSGTILMSNNGRTWHQQTAKSDIGLYDVNFSASGQGVIVGQGGAILTSINIRHIIDHENVTSLVDVLKKHGFEGEAEKLLMLDGLLAEQYHH